MPENKLNQRRVAEELGNTENAGTPAPEHAPPPSPEEIENTRGADIKNLTAILDVRDTLAESAGRKPLDVSSIENITTSEVRTRNGAIKAIMNLKAIFNEDPEDLDTNEGFARLFHNPQLARYFLIEADGKPAGVQLVRTNPGVPGAMYVPYGGLHEGYRNLHIYPQASKQNAEYMRTHYGISHSVHDFDDPDRYPAHAEGNPEDTREECEGRLNFMRRSFDTCVIRDNELPYDRPTVNRDEVQKTLVLAFRPLNPKDPQWTDVFNADRTAITKKAYGEIYLELMQLDYSDEYADLGRPPTKTELRHDFRAIDEFFTRLENSNKEWVSLDMTPIREKTTPNTDVPVTLVEDPKPDERERWKQAA